MSEGDAGELVAQLRRAAQVVEQAGLPDDLRAVAFGRVLDMDSACF